MIDKVVKIVDWFDGDRDAFLVGEIQWLHRVEGTVFVNCFDTPSHGLRLEISDYRWYRNLYKSNLLFSWLGSTVPRLIHVRNRRTGDQVVVFGQRQGVGGLPEFAEDLGARAALFLFGGYQAEQVAGELVK